MIILNLIFFPILLCGFFTIQPNEIVVVQSFGKPIKILSSPGLNWYFPLATQLKRASTALQTVEIKGSSVPDLNGSPLNVSVVITYQIKDAVKNFYNVINSY